MYVHFVCLDAHVEFSACEYGEQRTTSVSFFRDHIFDIELKKIDCVDRLMYMGDSPISSASKIEFKTCTIRPICFLFMLLVVLLLFNMDAVA